MKSYEAAYLVGGLFTLAAALLVLEAVLGGRRR